MSGQYEPIASSTLTALGVFNTKKYRAANDKRPDVGGDLLCCVSSGALELTW